MLLLDLGAGGPALAPPLLPGGTGPFSACVRPPRASSGPLGQIPGPPWRQVKAELFIPKLPDGSVQPLLFAAATW